MSRFLIAAIIAAVLAIAPLGSLTFAAEDKTHPNVVVMMVDNLGWGELGSYGGGKLRGAATPRLDQLAREGLRLQNFNVEPQCTPTRSAFMTARRPIRSGTTKVVWGMLYGLTNWEVTMAELFSRAGYKTPWRGNYFTAWEGSLRAPFLIRWPGMVPAGKVSNEIVHAVDILPTLANVAGFKVPNDRIIDGVDQLDFFLGKQEKSNREGFIVYNNDDVYAYKWRNWKMHLVELENMNSTPKPLNVPRIYNLITDPKEEHNMAAEATWLLPVMFKKIVAFQETLAEEPPIKLGTPDPYKPQR